MEMVYNIGQWTRFMRTKLLVQGNSGAGAHTSLREGKSWVVKFKD